MALTMLMAVSGGVLMLSDLQLLERLTSLVFEAMRKLFPVYVKAAHQLIIRNTGVPWSLIRYQWFQLSTVLQILELRRLPGALKMQQFHCTAVGQTIRDFFKK